VLVSPPPSRDLVPSHTLPAPTHAAFPHDPTIPRALSPHRYLDGHEKRDEECTSQQYCAVRAATLRCSGASRTAAAPGPALARPRRGRPVSGVLSPASVCHHYLPAAVMLVELRVNQLPVLPQHLPLILLLAAAYAVLTIVRARLAPSGAIHCGWLDFERHGPWASPGHLCLCAGLALSFWVCTHTTGHLP